MTEVEKLLMEACLSGNLSLVRRLALEGVDLGIKDNHSNSPLILAALGGNVETVAFLLSRGEEVNSTTVYGFTPLMAAAKAGHGELVKWLLSHGADPRLKADNGQSARDFALENGHDAIAGELGNRTTNN